MTYLKHFNFIYIFKKWCNKSTATKKICIYNQLIVTYAKHFPHYPKFGWVIFLKN